MKARLYIPLSMILVITLLLPAGAPLTMAAPSLAEQAQMEILFGPEDFFRGTGKPKVETREVAGDYFEHFMEPFILYVQNGDENGDNRVSSATLTLDGVEILGPSDFSQQIDGHEVEVYLTQESVMTVEITSKPGSYLRIWIEGMLKPGNAFIGPEGGEVVSEDGTASLNVPPGAVLDRVLFTVKVDEAIPSYPALESGGYAAVTPEIQLQPSDLSFLEPVILSVTYDEANIPADGDEGSLHMVRVSDSIEEFYDIEPVHIDTNQNVVTVALSRFSIYVVISPPLGIHVFSFKWDIDEIRYFIGADSYGFLWAESSELRNVVREAVESWVPHQGRFTMLEVQEESEANIVLHTAPKADVFDISKAKVRGVFPQYSYFRTLHEQDQITIDFASSEKWYDEYYCDEDRPRCRDLEKGLETVVRHEVGHALGLAHNPRSSSLRDPRVGVPAMWVAGFFFGDPWDEFKREMTGDDFAALQYHYGPPEVSSLLEEFDSPDGFTSTHPDQFVFSNGELNWTACRGPDYQILSRSIPSFSGDVRLTVRGRINSYVNNHWLWVGIGDEPGTGPGTGVGIMFGFTGGGCARRSAYIWGYPHDAFRRDGLPDDAQPDPCSGWLWSWLHPALGQYYTAELVISEGNATLTVPGLGSASGPIAYDGPYDTLFITSNYGTHSYCMSGAIDWVEIEPLTH